MLAENQQNQRGGVEKPRMDSESVVVETQSAPYATKIRPPQRHGRGLILTGAVGQFFLAGAAIGYGITRMVFWSSSSSYRTALPQFVAAAVFGVALFVQLTAFLAMGKRWRSAMGYATFGYGIAATAVFLAGAALYSFTAEFQCSYGYCHEHFKDYARIILFSGETLVGILLIMEGSAYIASGRQMNNAGSATTAGVLAIIGGGFVCSWALTPIGLLLIAPACIIAGIVLLLAPQQAIEVEQRMGM